MAGTVDYIDVGEHQDQDNTKTPFNAERQAGTNDDHKRGEGNTIKSPTRSYHRLQAARAAGQQQP